MLGAGSQTLSVTFTPTDGVDYSTATATVNLTVNKAILTVTANNASNVYGTANPAFTPTYSGFVNGDTSAVLTGSPSLTTTATAASPVGSYTITAAAGTLSRSQLFIRIRKRHAHHHQGDVQSLDQFNHQPVNLRPKRHLHIDRSWQRERCDPYRHRHAHQRRHNTARHNLVERERHSNIHNVYPARWGEHSATELQRRHQLFLGPGLAFWVTATQ